MTKKILITGVTGQVGSYLLKLLLEEENYDIYVFSRSKENKNAVERVEEVLKLWSPDVYLRKFYKVVVLDADITKKKFGLDNDKLRLLSREISCIYHCCALTKFNADFKELIKVNVTGFKYLLDFALECESLKKIIYLSTAYVGGNYKGKFAENDLDVGQTFNIPYEKSKFEAEKLAMDYRRKGLSIEVVRPAIVVGESKSGVTSTFKQSIYQLLHVLNHEIVKYLPLKGCYINTVFVDELCRGIYKIATKEKMINQTYHFFSPGLVSIEMILNKSHEMLGFKKPKILKPENYCRDSYSPVQLKILENNILLYNFKLKLDSYKTNLMLRKYGCNLSALDEKSLEKIIQFSKNVGFLK